MARDFGDGGEFGGHLIFSQRQWHPEMFFTPLQSFGAFQMGELRQEQTGAADYLDGQVPARKLSSDLRLGRAGEHLRPVLAAR